MGTDGVTLLSRWHEWRHSGAAAEADSADPANNPKSKGGMRKFKTPKFASAVWADWRKFLLAGLGSMVVGLAVIIGAPVDSSLALEVVLVVLGIALHGSLGGLVGDLAGTFGHRGPLGRIVENLAAGGIVCVLLLLLLEASYWFVVLNWSTIWVQLTVVSVVAFLCAYLVAYKFAVWPPNTARPVARTGTAPAKPPGGRLRAVSNAVIFPLASPGLVFGLVLGLSLPAIALIVSASRDTADQTNAPPILHVPDGTYNGSRVSVALGDSYTAGEGVSPYGVCHQSKKAYPRLLADTEGWPAPEFTSSAPCSGAVIADIFHTRFHGPQIPPGQPQRSDVRLVTLTIGGNDVFFSKIVVDCVSHPTCMWGKFSVGAKDDPNPVDPKPVPLEHIWALHKLLQVQGELATLFQGLRDHFGSQTRIVVIGYPYLFPDRSAPLLTLDLMCASILRRVDEADRVELRFMQDRFNDMLYEEAAKVDFDYISPRRLWAGHEPCGGHGQWTNSVQAFLDFQHPLLGSGDFHPSPTGQQALAALLSCYLLKHPDQPTAQEFTPPTTWFVPPSAIALANGHTLADPWGDYDNDLAGCGFTLHGPTTMRPAGE
jgi:hypothetical protein